MLILEVYGRPSPLQRHRHVGKRCYDPQVKDKEGSIWQLKAQFNQEPWEGAIELKLAFYFLPPKNTSYIRKQQMLNGLTPFTKRPDLSNLVKYIEDVGNDLLWKDDSQIIRLEASKLYGTKEKTLIIMTEPDSWIM